MTPREICERISSEVQVAAEILQEQVEQWTGSQQPLVLCRPKDEAEVSAILRLASEYGWKTATRGSGTQTTYGNLMKDLQVLIDMKAFHKIMDYSPADLVVSVQPGVTLQNLQTVLAEQNQFLPIDPYTESDSTIGGLLATAISGPLRALYGSWRDMTIALRVAYPNGEIVRTGAKVVKNVAGYDMTKLFIGSLGTLGIMTEATFKVRPKPKHVELCVFTGTLSSLRTLASQIMDSTLIPARFEYLYIPVLEMLSAQSSSMTSGEPSMAQWCLAIECHENQTGAADQTKTLLALANSIKNEDATLHCAVLKKTEVDTFWQDVRRGLTRTEWGTDLLVRYSAPPNQLLHVAQTLLHPYQQQSRSVLSATVPAGVGRILLSGLTHEEQCTFIVDSRKQVVAYGGTLVVEHAGVDIRRSIDVFGSLDALQQIHQNVKHSIDPNGVMSMGKFVGGI